MSPGHLNREKILTIFRAGLFSIAIPDVKHTLRCCQKKNVLNCDFRGNKLISAKRHGCPLAQHPCVGEKKGRVWRKMNEKTPSTPDQCETHSGYHLDMMYEFFHQFGA